MYPGMKANTGMNSEGKTRRKTAKGLAGHAHHREKKLDKAERDRTLREWMKEGPNSRQKPIMLPIGYRAPNKKNHRQKKHK